MLKKEKDKEKEKETVESPELKKDDDKEEELVNLRAKVFILETEIEKLKKEQNDKILEFVDKKSKEASDIIASKEKELSKKYKEEYESKLKYVHSKQLAELSDIIGQFELVINSTTSPEISNYLVGFKMFLSQFESLLSSFHIKAINPKVGDEFNSDTMEATSTKKVNNKDKDNKITAIFKKGYKLHERVIKLASVEVGKIKE